MLPTTNIDYQSKPQLVIGDGVQTDNVKPQAGTAYHQGDLLTVGPDNTAGHSLTGDDWSVVCALDITAEQATDLVAKGMEIPVYTQGELSVHAVRLNGVLLVTAAQKDTARARANSATAIELRKVVGEKY